MQDYNFACSSTRKTNTWVCNIKMGPGEIGWGCVDWIGMTQNRDQWKALVNVMANLWVK
jgi:hypothetical protein